MKKLLTVSLVAVMAVSAAHAKIASVEYVDPKFQSINTTIGTWGANQQAIGQDVATAVVNLKTSVDSMNGDGGSVKAAIDTAINTLVNEGQVKTNTTAIDNITKAGGVIDTKIEALDGQTGSVAADGSYVVQTTEANGVVTVSRQAFQTTVGDDNKGTVTTAPTVKAIVDYVDGVVEDYANNSSEGLGELQQALTDEAATARAAEKANADAAAAAQKAADDEVTRATTEEARIEGLVTAEANRAKGVEAGLDTAVKAAQKAADDEAARAQGVEAGLAADIAEKQVKSGADYVIGMTNGQWKALTELAQAVDACKGKQCALTVNDSQIKWEEVVNQ